MSGRGSRFSFRAAAPAIGFPRSRPGLRVTSDTILSQARIPRSAAITGSRNWLAIAALLVAVTAVAAAIVRRAAMFESFDRDLFRYNGIIVPLVGGLLAMLILAGRGIARGRALTALAIAAALCPLLAALGGDRLVTVVMMVSAAIAFAALAIALDWIGSRHAPSALRAGVIVAATQLGMAIGNSASRDLLSGPGLPVISAMLVLTIMPLGLAAVGFRRRPDPDIPPSLAATQVILGSYAMVGLLAAGLAAAASVQILLVAAPFVALGDESAVRAVAVSQGGSLFALIGGGLLADRVANNDRGYAVWFAATLGLAGVVALLSDWIGLVAAGHAVVAARLLPSAGVGAALALIVRLAPPDARLGTLIAFLATRAIGAAVVAPIVQNGLAGREARAASYGAIGLLIATAAVAATMPRLSRRDDGNG